MSTRICESCDTTVSTSRTRRYMWYRWDGYWLCCKCYHKYVYGPTRDKGKNAEYNRKRRERTMLFIDKVVLLDSRVLKGQCEICAKKIGDLYIDFHGKEQRIQRTNMHHIDYHPEDPLEDTIELCTSCHQREEWLQRGLRGYVRPRTPIVKDYSDRFCLYCGKNQTYTHNGKPWWFKGPRKGVEWICRKCHLWHKKHD